MEHPLGSMHSWWLHAVLAGATFTPAAVLSSLVPQGDLLGLLLLTLFGAAVGALCGPIAHAIATRAWNRARLLVFALGPAMGALGSLCVTMLTSRILDHRWIILRADEVVMLFSFGGVLLGPPWVGYLAVRARGRGVYGVLAASIVWAAAAGIAFIAAVGVWIDLR